MPKLTVHFQSDRYSDEELRSAIEEILDNNNTLALSTVDTGKGYINTAHFGYSPDFELFIITSVDTNHSKNAQKNPEVAVAIWNRPEKSGTDLQGVQLFGTYSLVRQSEIEKALNAYSTTDSNFLEKFPNREAFEKSGLTFHKITLHSLKLLNEPRFGRRNYIELTVMR